MALPAPTEPPKKEESKKKEEVSSALVLKEALENSQQIAIRDKKPEITWHAPWKLKKVISGHTGWVRSLAIDPMN